MNLLKRNILSISDDIRYVAVYHDGKLSSSVKNVVDSSNPESDKYGELIVNPTILTLAKQRGEIDCGDLEYVLIRYGNFYAFIQQIPKGHITVGIDPDSDPYRFIDQIRIIIRSFHTLFRNGNENVSFPDLVLSNIRYL